MKLVLFNISEFQLTLKLKQKLLEKLMKLKETPQPNNYNKKKPKTVSKKKITTFSTSNKKVKDQTDQLLTYIPQSLIQDVYLLVYKNL